MKDNAPSNEERDLKGEAPLLHGLKNAATGFRVPANYFENFADQLEPKLSADTKVIQLFRWKVAAVAASVLVLLSVGIWMLTDGTVESTTINSAQLWESEEMLFATSDVLFDEYEFALADTDDEATIDYLMGEDVAIELILEEFQP